MSDTPEPTDPDLTRKTMRTTEATWNRFKSFAAARGLTSDKALNRLLHTHRQAGELIDHVDGMDLDDVRVKLVHLEEVRDRAVDEGFDE